MQENIIIATIARDIFFLEKNIIKPKAMPRPIIGPLVSVEIKQYKKIVIEINNKTFIVLVFFSFNTL